MRDELERYMSLQQGLLVSLRNQLNTDGSLGSLPPRGEVDFEGGLWKFTRHGAGAIFRQVSTGVSVDIHDAFEQPTLFDVWRLRTYFASLGKRGNKCIQSATGIRGQPMDKALEQALSVLADVGEIEQVGTHYRLARRKAG